MSSSSLIRKELRKKADKSKAKFLQTFFKTGKGQYAEGDVFLGIVMPEIRKIAKKHKSISLKELSGLLASRFHEERMCALLILVEKYSLSKEKESLVRYYLQNKKSINNWDLIDVTSHKILGDWLKNRKDRSILFKLANSKSLWDRRISIMATFAFIRSKEYGTTLKLAEFLLDEEEDLIHKAVGWMLREIGKRDKKKEDAFLKKHAAKMHRTMLRYAIEKFPVKERKKYLDMRQISKKEVISCIQKAQK